MRDVRSILGIIAGVLVLASSAAHSLLGWPQLRAQLAAASVPQELITGLAVGWHFGGAAMVAFGLIVLSVFRERLAGRPASLWPALVIGIVYLAFGVGALAFARPDPFFLVFIVPGVLLVAATWGRSTRRGAA